VNLDGGVWRATKRAFQEHSANIAVAPAADATIRQLAIQSLATVRQMTVPVKQVFAQKNVLKFV